MCTTPPVRGGSHPTSVPNRPAAFAGTTATETGGLCCAGSAPDRRVAAGCAQEALVIDGVFPSAEDCAFANVLLVNKFLQSLDCAHPSHNLRLIMFEQEPIRGASDHELVIRGLRGDRLRGS